MAEKQSQDRANFDQLMGSVWRPPNGESQPQPAPAPQRNVLGVPFFSRQVSQVESNMELLRDHAGTINNLRNQFDNGNRGSLGIAINQVMRSYTTLVRRLLTRYGVLGNQMTYSLTRNSVVVRGYQELYQRVNLMADRRPREVQVQVGQRRPLGIQEQFNMVYAVQPEPEQEPVVGQEQSSSQVEQILPPEQFQLQQENDGQQTSLYDRESSHISNLMALEMEVLRSQAMGWGQEQARNNLRQHRMLRRQRLRQRRQSAIPHLTRQQIRTIQLTVYRQQEEEQSCSVCAIEFIPGRVLRRLPCGHVFHKSCSYTWLRRIANCPLCRVPLALRD